jgi:hypothetical protein
MKLLTHPELKRADHQRWLNAHDRTQTHSLLGDQQSKKPKVPEQRTYAEATFNLIRVAIVLMAYPDRKFEDEDVVLLKRLIEGCILDLVKGTKAPIFQGTSNRDGAVIFNCADEETVEWLKNLTTVLSIKVELHLCALKVDEQLKHQ